jgi:hypothetical protein
VQVAADRALDREVHVGHQVAVGFLGDRGGPPGTYQVAGNVGGPQGDRQE